MPKKIVTHDSSFHTDDIFAVATLLLMHPDAEVARSRDPEIHKTADYLVDTGMEYNPSLRRFDHHQSEGAGERGNTIPYASFGLVWKEYGEKLTGGKRETDLIDYKLVQPIDAHDNGVAIADYRIKNVREYVIGDFFNSYIESRDQVHLNATFMKILGFARELLLREISIAQKVILGEDKILALYNKSSDKRLVVLPEEFPGWKEVLGKTSETLYIIHPRPDGKWSLGCVPDLSKSYGVNRKPLPSTWAGKKDQELQKVTGVEDAIFAHRKLFMATAKTKEGALRLAQIALNA